MMRLIQAVLSSTFILVLAACSSYEVRRDRVDSVKKVALVGFQLVDRRAMTPAAVEELERGPQSGIQVEFAAPAHVLRASSADLIFNTFAKGIKNEMGWDVLPLNEMRSRNEYKSLYCEARGFSTALVEENDKYFLYRPDGVESVNKIKFLNLKERSQLMDALHVDALVVAQIQLDWAGMRSSTNINIDPGSGYIAQYFTNDHGKYTSYHVDNSGMHPQAWLQIFIYDRSDKDPILKAQNLNEPIADHFTSSDFNENGTFDLTPKDALLAQAAKSAARVFKADYAKNVH